MKSIRSSFRTKSKKTKVIEVPLFDVVDLDNVVDSRRRSKAKCGENEQTGCLVDPVPCVRSLSSFSLGTGLFPINGDISFEPSSAATNSARWSTTSEPSSWTEDDDDNSANHNDTKRNFLGSNSPFKKYLRSNSLFMRVSDVVHGLEHKFIGDSGDHESQPHYHHPSDDPPPGVEHDPNEVWVALDTGGGDHAPVAPFAVDALAKSGYQAAMKEEMWKPNKQTEKILNNSLNWASAVWSENGPIVVPPKGAPNENDVLIWSGQFSHGLYGSDLPTVRAEGVVNMSPLALVELLVDSSRVHEYNKMSLGRTDVLVLQDSLTQDGPFGRSVTKVVRSTSQPPLVRKALEFVTLMHARKLECGNGYLIVSRAVTQTAAALNVTEGMVLRSEILMGVNIIRNVQGDENRSVMINVNHIRSPMVPTFIAKKIGLSAAVGFFDDIRALC